MVRCDCSTKRIAAAKLEAVPQRFRACSLENYVPVDEVQEAGLSVVKANIGASLFLYGGYRRGKTHLAVAQYKALVSAGEGCLWRSMGELIHELRSADVKDEFSQVLQRARYDASFHLFVDDIDKFKPTDWKGEALFDLFDTIYRRDLRVTITSNWDLRSLVEDDKVHPAIVRRIDDMCTAVQL